MGGVGRVWESARAEGSGSRIEGGEEGVVVKLFEEIGTMFNERSSYLAESRQGLPCSKCRP